MSGTQSLAPNQQAEVLRESVREHRRVTLTHYGQDGWRLFKGRFASDPSAPEELKLHVSTDQFPDLGTRLKIGESVGCAFRVGHRKCLCTATIASIVVKGETAVLQVNPPNEIQQLQRRAFERATPPPGLVIAVRFWLNTGDGESRRDRVVRHGQLEDISAGGMRIRTPDPEDIVLETTYRCVFTTAPGRPAFLLDALLRHREAADQGRASLGFQFVGLETTPEGCKTLDRLARMVSHFQRSRHRRRPSQ
jgi:hypothetical protein